MQMLKNYEEMKENEKAGKALRPSQIMEQEQQIGDVDREDDEQQEPLKSLGEFLKDSMFSYKHEFKPITIDRLKKVLPRIFNPVIESIQATQENNRQLKEIQGLI